MFKRISIFIILILSMQNCDVLNSSDSDILPVDSKITFRIEEFYTNWDVEEPTISIYMETKKEYGSAGYFIDSQTKIVGNNINIDIIGIGDHGLAACEKRPAYKEIEFGNLKGNYTLHFRYKKYVDSFKLNVTDSYVSIDGANSRRMKTEYNLLWRRPKNSFACGYQLQDGDLEIYNDFFDTLTSEIDLEEFNFPETGEYSYPSDFSNDYYTYRVRYFYYKNEEDFLKIEPILAKYKKDHFNAHMYVSCINWKNARIRS